MSHVKIAFVAFAIMQADLELVHYLYTLLSLSKTSSLKQKMHDACSGAAQSVSAQDESKNYALFAEHSAAVVQPGLYEALSTLRSVGTGP